MGTTSIAGSKERGGRQTCEMETKDLIKLLWLRD
jgi:hypothetical protein